MTRKNVVATSAFLCTLLVSATAFAQDSTPLSSADGFALFAAAIAISVAAFGGALGQGKAAAAALEGIARNPSASDKLFTPMILGLALIESLVIYAFVIAYLTLTKVG